MRLIGSGTVSIAHQRNDLIVGEMTMGDPIEAEEVRVEDVEVSMMTMEIDLIEVVLVGDEVDIVMKRTGGLTEVEDVGVIPEEVVVEEVLTEDHLITKILNAEHPLSRILLKISHLGLDLDLLIRKWIRSDHLLHPAWLRSIQALKLNLGQLMIIA